jgi:hypothetical protein
MLCAMTSPDVHSAEAQGFLSGLPRGVIEFEPERALATRGDIGPFSGDIAYVLEHVRGTTVLKNTCSLRARGAAGLVAPLLTRQVRSAVAANLGVLRQLLERGEA